MADWDLQAVVRGCSSSSTTTSTSFSAVTSCSLAFDPPIGLLPPQDNTFLVSPDPFQSRTTDGFEELFELFKPIPPKSQPLSSQTRPISPLSVLGGLQDLSPPAPSLLPQPPPPAQTPQQSRSVVVPRAVNTHNPAPPKPKRRKNQMKRVCQVPAEGLASDMWSWRKYGQKPIKGSPYPRGYYKCSTLKGCTARKQVERNRSDPGMFIVTYTGEHNHPIPTHRNSLAGSTRQKSPASADGENKQQPACSSPISPISFSPDADKLDSKDDLEDLIMEEEDDGFSVLIPDMAVGDDFFEGLEELDQCPGNGDSTADGGR